MGRSGKNWLSSVKKAFSPESNKKKSQKLNSKHVADEESAVEDPSLLVPHPLPLPEKQELTGGEDKEINTSSDSEAVAIATEHESVLESSPEVVIIPGVDQFKGKSDDAAAIKIQSLFRGYQARRSLRAQRGMARLKALVQGPPVKRQTANALKCMQTLARVQSQIQSRRMRMSEENQALQRQLLLKRAKELASLRDDEVWDDSPQSKEELEANLLNKYEAAMRREKAMAYSFTHQQTWKKSAKPTILMFMDPNNPQWGWSWLERWMEAHPWDEKEITNDTSSLKSASLLSTGGEITKSYANHLLNGDKPSTPRPKATPLSRKLKFPSPKESISSPKSSDPKSPLSLKSEKNRRHSVGGPLVREEESVPSYMAATKSANAKLKPQSPLGIKNGTVEKDVIGPTKKRLSFPSSPARPRRHSGPPKVDLGPVLDQNVTNSVATEDIV